MARRYSDHEVAVIWAMRCQGMQPIDIRRALAADAAGLGYEVEVPKRSMRDILKRCEEQYGSPKPTIEPEEEVDALAAIRREALGAIRDTVRTLRAKESLDQGEIKTLSNALTAVDGVERRAREKTTAQHRGTDAKDKKASAPSSFITNLAKQLEDRVEPVAAGVPTNGDGSGDSNAGE